MKTTLVIMAAGIGSRFGQGIKQLEIMNEHDDNSKGEIIIDYSIYDAVEAGFNKIVFIIRKEIEEDFREVIGDRIERSLRDKNVEIAYAYQELSYIPDGFSLPLARKKPWGTGHAVLCAKDHIDSPFVIINADDYYGKKAFVKLHDFLINNYEKNENTDKYIMAMAAFILKNTISEHGSVTRGVCKIDENSKVKKVYETSGIRLNDAGRIVCDDPIVSKWIEKESKVSMNMWAAYPDFLSYLEKDFVRFLQDDKKEPLKKEHLLPIIVDGLLSDGKVDLTAIETDDKWIGITYKEDADLARSSFKQMLDNNEYPKILWE